MNFSALIGNSAWLATSTSEWLRFRAAAGSLERTQRLQLKFCLNRNTNSQFGKEHGFERIKDWESYTENVPVRTFDEFRPYVEKIRRGDPRVLTEKSVRLLEPSSGSSGPAKLVPYTADLQAEFRRAVASWITPAFLSRPNLLAGRSYWSLTPSLPETEKLESKVPVGFATDSEYLGGAAAALISRTLVIPPELRLIRDMEMFWRLTLLLLLKCSDLRMISVWHPSFVSLLIDHLNRNWDQLLQNLHDGVSLRQPDIVVGPAVSRARQLGTMDPAMPLQIWPQLGLISCWTDAHAANHLQIIKASFPGVELQPKGLVATEAFVTIPIDGLRPLAIRSHFFEFRDEAGKIHPSWQLESGQLYTVIVSTGGGLYRYDLGDRVQVDGFWRQVPSLRFLGKNEGISDYFGEKLSEPFVAATVHELLESFSLQAGFAMLALDDSGHKPRYVLYLECRDAVPPQLVTRLDAALRRNPHYNLCVRLGQLATARIEPVGRGSFACYAGRLAKQGMKLGDVKPAALSSMKDWQGCFQAGASVQ